MSKRQAPPAIRKVANILRSNGYTATKDDRPGILISGHGRHEIVSEGDRGYRWRDDAGRVSEDYFLCDLYLLDNDGADEVADALIHMLEE